MNAGVDVADVPGDGVGRGVVGAFDGVAAVFVLVPEAEEDTYLAHGQRVGDDDVGHIGLCR